MAEELRKKAQLLLVRETEVETLRGMVKELKETVEGNDASRELQDMKKQLQFAGTEKAMKEVMIEQLKKEVERNLLQVMEAKEKEAQMAAVINALTVQNAMATQAKAPQKKPDPKKPNLSLI